MALFADILTHSSSTKVSAVLINLKWPTWTPGGNMYFNHFYLTLLSQVCIYLVFFAACGPSEQMCKVASWFPWFYSSGFLPPFGFFLLISWNTWALLLAPKTLLLPDILPCLSARLTLFQRLLGSVQLRSAGKLVATTHHSSPSPALLILEVWSEAKESAHKNS